MNPTTRRLLYWTPRILCMAFAAFLALFAMDVFGMPMDPWQKALALLMHLIPTIIMVLAVVIVWRREWIGAGLFPLLALAHLVSKWGQLDWIAYVMIEGPLVLLGILFWFNWQNRATLRPSGR